MSADKEFLEESERHRREWEAMTPKQQWRRLKELEKSLNAALRRSVKTVAKGALQ